MQVSSRAVAVDERAHVVHFYKDDDDLVPTVSRYLADALRAGEVAIAVATPEHATAFESAIAAAGIDTDAARADGRLIVVDAADTLADFLAGPHPDPAAFGAVIGRLIEHAASTGRAVRIYGEMVALLWHTGQVVAAIELEALWNGLADEMPFSLLCAYPTASVLADGHEDAFTDICGLHSDVFGPPETQRAAATRRFPAAFDAPRAARAFVIETLTEWNLRHLVPDAALIVTELATNAVIHAGGDFTVLVSSRQDVIRISTRDADVTVPTLRHAPGSPVGAPAVGLSGRGLALVAASASSWGVELLPAGKAVWAELRS